MEDAEVGEAVLEGLGNERVCVGDGRGPREVRDTVLLSKNQWYIYIV